MLQDNLRASGLDAATVKAVAIGRRPAQLQMHTGPAGNLGGTHTRAVSDASHPDVVPVQPLSHLVDWNCLRPGWLKVDVEGDEFAVLQALADAQLQHQFPLGSIEVTPAALESRGHTPDLLVGLLKQLGYALFVIPNGYSRDFYRATLAQPVLELQGLQRWPADLRRADLLMVLGTQLPTMRLHNIMHRPALA